MPFVLRDGCSNAEIKAFFDHEFNTARPQDHIHGAILALSNPHFATQPAASPTNLIIDMTLLITRHFRIGDFIKAALADNAIRFRPDTPIHANDEGRYHGGTLASRRGEPRHFEFGAVAGGMRVVFDNEISEIYISAHYAYPGRLVAGAGREQEEWLLTVKDRLHKECGIMEDHASGYTAKQRDLVNTLRQQSMNPDQATSLGLMQTAKDKVAKEAQADRLDGLLLLRATSNTAFAHWMLQPQANMPPDRRNTLYGV